MVPVASFFLSAISILDIELGTLPIARRDLAQAAQVRVARMSDRDMRVRGCKVPGVAALTRATLALTLSLLLAQHCA
jgi:hypothetical protein